MKPWGLSAERQPEISTYRELVAHQVRLTVRPEDTLGEIVRRFWAKFSCKACGKLGACIHRDRKADIRLILGDK